MIKKYLSALALIAACHIAAPAVEIVDGVSVDYVLSEHDGSFLLLDITMGLQELSVASSQCVVLQPALVNGTDSVVLPPVAIYGRNRYYYYERLHGGDPLAVPGTMAYRAGHAPASVEYHQLLPYEQWMDGASITLRRIDRGCCGGEVANNFGQVGFHFEPLIPELVFVQPEAVMEKRRALEGSAFIDFPVNKTEIYPDYRRNASELAAIRATIDSVRLDPDATIDGVWLKGFASPEGSYARNAQLAKGRTKALNDYIDRLYRFPGAAMTTDFEPEDWQGLREAVAASNLDHRDAILAIIDSSLDPDPKEAKIKSLYPQEYKFMLQEFYPALRHTNYRVSYVIRQFNDPVEILKIMKTQPQKLSLNEFYVAASALEPESQDFADVFETAVRMFPDDEVANLNAANAAMQRADINAAKRYAAKAGSSPEALYTRGAIAVRERDYAAARPLLKQAADAGLAKAKATLDELNRRTGN